MKRKFVWLLACTTLLFFAAAQSSGCTTDASSKFDGDDDGDGAGGDLGVGGGLSSAGGGLPNTVVGTLTGKVMAPEGTIPISGALVYLTPTSPDAIPQQVYCDKCIDLGTETPHTLSTADGTFALDAYQPGDQFLVVQKGAFRRVRTINVVEGDQALGLDVTTLPAAHDPGNGDSIPKMAVMDGVYDDIENTLAKLGLGQTDTSGALLSGTESFDLIQNTARDAFLTDYNTLSQYHIVFFPCDFSWADTHLTSSTVLDNLNNFMEAGGRLYVTDYAYDVLRQARPEPITWVGDSGGFGDAESGLYDSNSSATDPGLGDWLTAQGISTFVAEANWTEIQSVNPYTAPDEDGVSTMFDPTVWVTGDVNGTQRPLTVSYQHGCGRALFSTYHTEAGPNLLVQEKALLYILLEVAVCIGEIGPPQ